MSIVDAAERRNALEVTRSFCVTAPAGSGKTELLIQRFLALLARVQRPEQVLAITFTRKAAAEMRERVMQALLAAQRNSACEGEHELTTRELAKAALVAGETQGWHLTRDSSRLNIKTIDSFCAGLTRQLPIMSQFGGQAQAVDDASPLYREAVTDLFKLLESQRPEAEDLEQLLLHFDNNWQRMSDLLVTMLGKRDQWHEHMGVRASPVEAEQRLHAMVAALVDEKLGELASLLEPFEDELFELFCYAQHNLQQPVPDEFPSAQSSDLSYWRSLINMLLTQDAKYRKSVNVRNGFPAGKGEAQDYKDHCKDLLERMAAQEQLLPALVAVTALPDMDEHAASWQLVVHLSHVLPLVAACLLLVFERRGEVDHTQVALSALDALGEDDAPTELAMRLDYSIEHILVDEFQDTAINQYRLLGRLTRGWGEYNEANPTAPRTVFIVGDGMQSIYGFRNANVGLFLRARDRGFNGVEPIAVDLKSNFRSSSAVVDWVNDTFAKAFPPHSDVRRSMVSYTPATAVKPVLVEAAIEQHAFHGDFATEQEACFIADQIEAKLNDETYASIALLGRSRGQLAVTLAELRRRGIGFAAEDMDPLSGSPAIVDLLNLCRALANAADRVAWYGLLRSPWVALDTADLLALAQSSEHSRWQNLAAVLRARAWPETVSSSGRAALERLAVCLDWAWHKRERLALRVWVEQLWLSLGGPESVVHGRYLEDAQRFFELLQEAESVCGYLDISWLDERIARLYASGEGASAKLKVMTLHKSKGLEFDWVIIPALGRGTRGDGRDILLWDEYITPGGDRGFLLAADDHSDKNAPSLYNFLKAQRAEKSRLETTRLLYVGATRAVKKLTLSAVLGETSQRNPGEAAEIKPPPEGALLSRIWPTFCSQMTLHEPLEPPAQAASADVGLTRVLTLPPVPNLTAQAEEGAPNIPEQALNRADRHVGTVIHEQLERLAMMPGLPEQLSPDDDQGVALRLRELGLGGALLQPATTRVLDAVNRTLADEEAGRWILSSEHGAAANELEITLVAADGSAQELIVDRTFVDRGTGTRWIIDYKSSVPAEGDSVEAFLQHEAERYRPQLDGYRRGLAGFGAEPIKCALYFTGLGRLQVIDAN
ncbi:DNA helicase UvrD [Halioglobus maricola]|uniref:DNA 3'-5' helicase n=1 Tax=Halioglobus maricola TaxID=2601894 RepID=A0A5P9NJM8_9GAMM|nr:UvrD-helicase domain-containing protein [Halioglobus maricola]QFU75977.1 DNA helicase UvrD [Halioglobus maricola]